MCFICYEPPVAFVHIPKCGGQSVGRMLTARYQGALRGHYPAHVMRDRYPDLDWGAAWKFVVVRNPWDRLVSIWAFSTQRKRKKPRHSIVDKMYRQTFSDDPLENRRIVRDLSFRDWFWWVVETGWNHFADHTNAIRDLQSRWFDGEFEVFNLEDLSPLAARLGRGERHLNVSFHEDYRSYYDAEMWEYVRAAHEADIERFGYGTDHLVHEQPE